VVQAAGWISPGAASGGELPTVDSGVNLVVPVVATPWGARVSPGARWSWATAEQPLVVASTAT
jgi:hypothetical protein